MDWAAGSFFDTTTTISCFWLVVWGAGQRCAATIPSVHLSLTDRGSSPLHLECSRLSLRAFVFLPSRPVALSGAYHDLDLGLDDTFFYACNVCADLEAEYSQSIPLGLQHPNRAAAR